MKPWSKCACWGEARAVPRLLGTGHANVGVINRFSPTDAVPETPARPPSHPMMWAFDFVTVLLRPVHQMPMGCWSRRGRQHPVCQPDSVASVADSMGAPADRPSQLAEMFI